MTRFDPTRLVAMIAALVFAAGGDAGAQPDDLFGDDETTTAVDDSLWAAASADEGRRVFRAVCAGCHGAKGDGDSEVAATMVPRPRDLTAGEYRFRSTATGKLPLRSDIMRTLERGLPGTPMPSWRAQLTAAQMRSVVLYLETLSPRFERERALTEAQVDRDTVEIVASTPALITKGREIYEEMKCADCHGPGGQGDGEAAATLTDNDGSPSHVFDFTDGRYKGGYDVFDVYRTFTTGLNGTPMPSFDGSLPSETDRWALVHYVRSLTKSRGLWFYLSNRPTHEDPSFADSGEAVTKGETDEE